MSGIYAYDERLLLWLNHLGEGSLHREAVIRVVATGFPFAIVAIVLLVVFWRGGGWRMFLRAFLSTLIAFSIGKLITQFHVRERPFEYSPDEVLYVEALIVRPGSFPSIHAVASWGLVGALLFSQFRSWGLVASLFGIAMLAGRAAAGVHWPIDLVGGAAIGLASAWAISVLAGEYGARVEEEVEEEAEEDLLEEEENT